jgi:hemoglobin-like flavoprotein
MSPENQQRVRASWARIEHRPEPFADAFYAHLFELDPQIHAMFASTDMVAHRRKFVDMLGALVAALDEPTDLVTSLAASGRRHAGYGVRDEHYAIVVGALLWSLEHCLGPDFDAATKQAWRELCTLIAAIMRRGADHEKAAASLPSAMPTPVRRPMA